MEELCFKCHRMCCGVTCYNRLGAMVGGADDRNIKIFGELFSVSRGPLAAKVFRRSWKRNGGAEPAERRPAHTTEFTAMTIERDGGEMLGDL